MSEAGQNLDTLVSPDRTLIDSFSLARLSRLALQLPDQQFSGHNIQETENVQGHRSLYGTEISMRQVLDESAEDPVTRITDIKIERSPKDLFIVTGLTVDEYEEDDLASIYGIDPSHRRFSLDRAGNELSLWNVMRRTSRAVKIVRQHRERAENPRSIYAAYP